MGHLVSFQLNELSESSNAAYKSFYWNWATPISSIFNYYVCNTNTMLFHNQIYFYFYTGYSYQMSSESDKQEKLMQKFLFQPTSMNDKPKLNQASKQILEK